MRHAWTALVLAAGVLGSGCGKPVLREADPSLGDYYTNEEYKHLTKEERQQYCEDLANQLETYQDDIQANGEALAALQQGTPALRAEVDSLKALQAALAESLAAARARPSRPTPTTKQETTATGSPATRYVVRPGDSLWRISRGSGVYGSGGAWERLYQGNRDKIRDPNLIFPGQEIEVPR